MFMLNARTKKDILLTYKGIKMQKQVQDLSPDIERMNLINK